ncbi:MAG: hypothetical protein ACRENI_01475 [Gemmatimonadaceae bacterium]
MSRVRTALLPAIVLASGVVAFGCDEIGLGPTDVLSIEFDSLPYPAVVRGDTLRDENGVPAPLFAVALNAQGDTVTGAEISFLALDEGFVTISPAGIVTSDETGTGQVRIVAGVGGLQTLPLSLRVTNEPALVEAAGAVADTVEHDLIEPVQSDPLTVTLRSSPADSLVRGWIVHYEVVTPADPADVPGAIVASINAQSASDTTDESGQASRRFRVDPPRLPPTGVDTVVIHATVRYRGAPIAGSPVEFTLLIRPSG